MQNVTLDIKDEIAVLRFSNGVTNAISPALLADLETALGKVKSEAKGLVIASGDKFFSIGFDLPSLLQLERQGMTEFYRQFNDLVIDILTLPIPTASAVNGHAAGGGCIFAMASDYRFMAGGRKMIGLNEVSIGLPTPYLTALMLWQLLGDRDARDIAYGGALNPVDYACEVGLVDEVVPAEELEQKAIDKVAGLAKLPGSGFAEVKRQRFEQICQRYAANREEQDEIFIDIFYQPEVHSSLQEAAKKF